MSNGALRFCTTCRERFWVRYDTDGKGHDVEIAEPCACKRAAELLPTPTERESMMTPESEAAAEPGPVAVRKHGALAAEIRDALRAILQGHPTATFAMVHKLVEQALGHEVQGGNITLPLKWMRAELGIVDAPPNENGAKPSKRALKVKAKAAAVVEEPVAPTAADPEPAPEPVSPPPSEPEEDEEIDSVLTREERTEPEGVFVEQAQDGWVVRAHLFARSRSEAFRLAAGLMLATEPAYLDPRRES